MRSFIDGNEDEVFREDVDSSRPFLNSFVAPLSKPWKIEMNFGLNKTFFDFFKLAILGNFYKSNG